MKYGKIVEGKFIDRPNRFIAHVEIAGKAETVHVKNTGRCRELLLPGAAVRLEQSDNPARKTLYDLVAVYKDRIGWINIDSQAPNKVVKECTHGSERLYSGDQRHRLFSRCTHGAWGEASAGTGRSETGRI